MAEEKRLIDANALERNVWLDGACLVIAVSEVDNAPTVDAVEVAHGRWISVDSSYWRWAHDGGHTVEHITYRCSECSRKSIIKTNYCPNCGAKMDLKGE